LGSYAAAMQQSNLRRQCTSLHCISPYPGAISLGICASLLPIFPSIEFFLPANNSSSLAQPRSKIQLTISLSLSFDSDLACRPGLLLLSHYHPSAHRIFVRPFKPLTQILLASPINSSPPRSCRKRTSKVLPSCTTGRGSLPRTRNTEPGGSYIGARR
jgi:hypothetical protein